MLLVCCTGMLRAINLASSLSGHRWQVGMYVFKADIVYREGFE